MSELARKHIKTLKHLRTMHDSGMYPGDWWDSAPKQHAYLERLGLVEIYTPHNPVHKIRAAITWRGREYLESIGE